VTLYPLLKKDIVRKENKPITMQSQYWLTINASCFLNVLICDLKEGKKVGSSSIILVGNLKPELLQAISQGFGYTSNSCQS